MLKALVIGCGRMGQTRAKSLTTHSGVEEVHGIDRVSSLAKELEGKGLLSLALDWENFPDLKDYGLVVICTPPNEHASTILSAVEGGVPVFVEKPLAASPEDITSIYSAVTSGSSPVIVGFMHRVRDSVKHLRQIIEADGDKVAGVSWRWIGGKDKKDWWADRSQSGGPFVEQASHLVDTLIYLFEDITAVNAVGGADGEQVAFSCAFPQGCFGAGVYACTSDRKDMVITFHCNNNNYSLRGWDMDLYENDTLIVPGREDGTPRESVFDVEMEAFINGVTTGTWDSSLCTVADAKKTMDVVAQIDKYTQL